MALTRKETLNFKQKLKHFKYFRDKQIQEKLNLFQKITNLKGEAFI